jgi:hypothetical protein
LVTTGWMVPSYQTSCVYSPVKIIKLNGDLGYKDGTSSFCL